MCSFLKALGRLCVAHDARGHKLERRLLLRCGCGKLIWQDDVDKLRKHSYHGHIKAAVGGSFIEFILIKMRLI